MRKITSFTEFKKAELELIRLNDRLAELKEEVAHRVATLDVSDRLTDPREQELAEELDKVEHRLIELFYRMGKFIPTRNVSQECKQKQNVQIELDDEVYNLSDLDDYIWR